MSTWLTWQSTTLQGPQGLLRNYWQNQLLDILQNNLLAADLCDKQVIPANSGTAIEFHRINSFKKQLIGVSQALGAYTVGDLKGRTFSVDSIVYSLKLLTNDLQITEQAIMTAEPSPIPILTERFLYNAKDTLDQHLINIMICNRGDSLTVLATPPSVTYFGASVSTSVTWGDGSQTLTEATLDADNPSHRIAAETFNTVYTRLRSRGAKPRSGRLYDCLIAPEIAGDLRTDATFQDIALKGANRGEDKFEKASIGDVFGVRVMEDENIGVGTAGTIDATNDQIYRCPVVGQGYVSRISHAKGQGVPSVNFIPPGKIDKADPYGLLGIMTWKMYVADGGVTNPLAGEIIKVASTRAKNTTQAENKVWQ